MTKKESNVAKEFGLGIGLFLAFVAIAIVLSIFYSVSSAPQKSSDVNRFEVKPVYSDIVNQATDEAVKSMDTINKEAQKITEENYDKAIEKVTNTKKIDEPVKSEPSVNTFEPVSSTNKGLTLTLKGIKFENKDDWGKITSLSYNFKNQGTEDKHFTLNVLVYQEDSTLEEKGYVQEKVDLGLIPSGREKGDTIPVEISISDINKTKIIKLVVGDSFAFYRAGTKVSVEKKINLSEYN